MPPRTELLSTTEIRAELTAKSYQPGTRDFAKAMSDAYAFDHVTDEGVQLYRRIPKKAGVTA